MEKPARNITLRFTVWDGDQSLRVIRRVLKQFEEEHPGIKVKLENFSDYNLYHQKMLVQYAANVAPDVAMMDMGHFQALAKRKALLPLNQFYDKTPGFDIGKFYKSIVDAHSYQGTCYVLPRDIAPMGLIYYNKRLFDQAGIPYPDGTWTWDFKARPELREKCFIWVCQQLTKKDPDIKKTRWAFASGWPELLAKSFAFSSGGFTANDIENPTKVTFASEEMVRGYQYASDFMNSLGYMPNSTETSASLMATTQQLFAQQKIAMYQNGIWEVPRMREMLVPGTDEFFEWDITLFPAYKDGTYGAPTGGSGYSIFASTPHPEAAWKLVSYMSGPIAMEAMARAGIAQPAIRELALKPGVWVPGPDTPKEQLYPPSRIVTDQAVQYVVWEPNSEYWPSVVERMTAGLDLLWNAKVKAEDVMKRGEANAQTRLDTLRKEEVLAPFDWRIGGVFALVIVSAVLFWIYWPERNNKLTQRGKQENLAAYKFLAPWLIGLIVFTLGPMILSFLMSFADWDMIMPAKARGLENYREAMAVDPVFWKSLKVTFIYTFFTVPIGIIGSLLLALLLNQKVKGVPVFRAFYYIPSLTSLVAASLIWRRVFNPTDGLINNLIYGWMPQVGSWLSTIAGNADKPADWFGSEALALPALIIMSVWGVGGGMVILLAGLQGIPQYYYEAATLDGAGIMHKFRNVTLPLLTPTLFFTLVTGIIGSFQVFTQSFVMTQGGPNDATRFYMLHTYRAAFEQLRMGYSAALSWILFLIILVFTLIQFKGSKWVYYEADNK
jgi:multiple sugar transport system permease protein